LVACSSDSSHIRRGDEGVRLRLRCAARRALIGIKGMRKGQAASKGPLAGAVLIGKFKHSAAAGRSCGHFS
jgi:hypothetical protein